MKAWPRQDRLKPGLRAFGVPASAGSSVVLQVKLGFMNWPWARGVPVAVVRGQTAVNRGQSRSIAVNRGMDTPLGEGFRLRQGYGGHGKLKPETSYIGPCVRAQGAERQERLEHA
jgi:hypothetical protein